jgi:hypothetical protein
MGDNEQLKYCNSLLSGGNHAAMKALHPETCAIIDTIFNRIRELEGLEQISKTKVESKYQTLLPIMEQNKEKQNQKE